MSVKTSTTIKLDNMRLLMEHIIQLRSFSRVELSRLTSLNKVTVSTAISEFVDSKLVVKTEDIVKTSGRSAQVFTLNKNAGRIISIELFPNHINGIISNLYGEILYNKIIDIPVNDFNHYLTYLLEIIDELKENTYESVYGLIGIGIAVYGIVSKDQVIKYSSFNKWQDIDLKKIIEDYTGIETYVQNESNINALGESILNKSSYNIVSYHIGQGVGMGIIIDKNLYAGEDGYAGEIGHTILIPNGKKCDCGNYGCLERYISEKAILNDYYEATNKIITIDEFIELYLKKDPDAIAIYKSFIMHTSISINNISQIINPHTIIINSKIIAEIPESLSSIKNQLYSKLMNLKHLTSKNTLSNVVGLTHILIKKFLDVENYKIK